MAQTERIQEFRKTHDATWRDFTSGNFYLDELPWTQAHSVGTTIDRDPGEFQFAHSRYLELIQELEVVATPLTTCVFEDNVDPKLFTSGAWLAIFSSSLEKDAGSYVALGAVTKPIKMLQDVVNYAQLKGLQKIADRLVELGELPCDDELPLNVEAAKCFVDYCISRPKQTRPLMTVTPKGELDAIWKGPDDQVQTIRFFPDKTVWVAFELTVIKKGSFSTTASNLLNPNLEYKIPGWA